ncbi:MAG: transposase [Gammaproteobacteria bacterium]|nr:transposase [Gammaproteobacteria bacterium]
MTRSARLDLPGVPQHVVQRGNNRHAIFVADADRRFFLAALRLAATRNDVAIHAYVLMDNHVHLLATPACPGAVGRMMQSTGVRYVAWFNRRYGRSGTLWEGRYRAIVIERDDYLLACHRYIELNPLRAGLVARPGAFGWSSYAANADGIPDPLVTPHPIYLALAASAARRRAHYRALFEVALDPPMLAGLRGGARNARRPDSVSDTVT